MSRKDDFSEICTLGGLTEVDIRTGWPGIAEFESPSDGGMRIVALHAAPVAAHRTSNPDEVKVEPPGRCRPVEAPLGHVVVVVGHTTVVTDDEPRHVLVAVDRDERWNATFFRPLLAEAALNGWATYERSLADGGTEFLHAFSPALLVNYLDMIASDVQTLPPGIVSVAVAGSGLLQDEADNVARDRAIQTVNRVLRDRKFGQRQREAYAGACAMCGLTLNLNQGAHVYPVESGEGTDHVSNGFYACLLHHKAFDDHRIHIDPATLVIRLHPDLVAAAAENGANERFVALTFTHLAIPAAPANRLDPAWLRRRYGYYEGRYAWAGVR